MPRGKTMEEGRIDNKIKLGPRLINLNIKIVDENLPKVILSISSWNCC